MHVSLPKQCAEYEPPVFKIYWEILCAKGEIRNIKRYFDAFFPPLVLCNFLAEQGCMRVSKRFTEKETPYAVTLENVLSAKSSEGYFSNVLIMARTLPNEEHDSKNSITVTQGEYHECRTQNSGC
jgi:hypothetical protein